MNMEINQVYRVVLMLLKHGKKYANRPIQTKRWEFAGWILSASPRKIELWKSFRLDRGYWVHANIDPRSQLGLAIRKS